MTPIFMSVAESPRAVVCVLEGYLDGGGRELNKEAV